MTSIGADISIGQNEVDSYTWPLTITGDTRITISENITLSSSNQYFIIGGVEVTINGGNFIITISNVNGYPGLVKNGGYSYQSSILTASADAYQNTTLKNIIVEASTSCLAGIVSDSSSLDGKDYNNGWICQAFFGNGASYDNNIVYNCSTNGNTYSYNTEGTYYYINPDDNSITTHSGQISAVSGGCILGDYSYATAEHCYSTGAIGDSNYNQSCGGIFGNNCSGKAVNCYSTGAIENYSGGIFGANTLGYTAALWCYSSGTITNNAGGIFGASPGGHSIARNCHSTGNISNSSGGIFAPGTGSVDAVSCYSTGNISNSSGGIFNYTNGSSAYYCYSTGEITNNSAGITAFYINYGIYIIGCYSSGNIDSTSCGIVISDFGDYSNPAYAAIYNSYSTGTYTNDNGIANSANVLDCYTSNGSWSDDDASSANLNRRNNWVNFSNNSPWKFSKQYITEDTTFTNDDFYTTSSVDVTKLYCWPLYIGANVTVTIGSDVTIYNPSQYFVINGANSTIDGGKYTITVKGVNGYPGLVKNGTFTYYGQDDGTTKIGDGYGAYDNVIVQNVIVNATDSCLASLVYDSTNENSNEFDECGSGWICHAFYGSGVSNYETLIVENCSTNGTTYTYDSVNNYYYISPSDKITIKRHESHGTISGGCIMGDYSIAIILNCYSTGSIGNTNENMFAGGIMGRYCCGRIINCYSTGEITSSSGGIIGGNSKSYGIIITNIQWCYSTGPISTNSGGIYGGSAGENSRAIHCYSTGAISNGSGGIFGQNTYYVNASCCYSTGSIDNNSGGILAQSNSNFNVITCYSTGAMSNNSGGIISSYSGDAGGHISGCYSTGYIDGTSCGIFINDTATTNVQINACYSTGQISDGGNGIANYGTIQYCYSANNSWSDADATAAQLNQNNSWTIVTSDTPWKFSCQYITSDISISENMSYYFSETYYVWPIYIVAENVTVNIGCTNGLVIYNRNQYIEILSSNTTINGDGGNITIYKVGGYPGLVKNGGYYYNENGNITASANAYSNTTIKQIGINAVNSYLLAISGSNVLLNAGDDKTGNGWVCQAYYGNGGSDNSVNECSANGNTYSKYWVTQDSVYDTNTGNTYGGCIVGDYANVNVTNSYSTGTIGNGGGGICGRYNSGNASSCYSSGAIGTLGGGILGAANSGNASSCYSMGTIGDLAGGILASSNSGNAYDCYSTGAITGNMSGGIFGNGCTGSANNCYSTGTITGNMAAGIAGGMMNFATVNNCYSANGTWTDTAAIDAGMYKSDANGILWIATSEDGNSPWKLAAFNKSIFDNPFITIYNSETESFIQTLNDYGKTFTNISLFKENGLYGNSLPVTISNDDMIHTSGFSFDSITQIAKTFIISLYAYNTDSAFGSIDNVSSYSLTSLYIRAINHSSSIGFSSIQPTVTLIKDINAGSASSTIADLTNFNEKLLFTATNDSSGRELWITDGTTEGTTMIKDINPGSNSSTPYSFTTFNNKMLFTASTGIYGTECWVTDGTEAGTQMIKDINSGSDSVSSANFTVLGDKVIFTATDGTHGYECWVTDGTEAGTQLLKDINEGSNTSSPYNFVVLDDSVVFTADNGSNGVELWITDGTTAGTKLIKDIYTGTDSSYPNNSIVFNDGFSNRLFFTATTSVGKELWITDGTTSGTYLVKDINSGSGSSDPMNFVIFNNGTGNKLLFNATTSTNGAELWISDGSEKGTIMVKDIYPGESYGYPFNFTVFHDGTSQKVLFTANNAEYGYELWITDGTESGTTIVKDMYEGTEGSYPNAFFVFNHGTSDKILFKAMDNNGKYNVWVTDGTTEGTFMLKQLDPEIIPYGPSTFCTFHDGKQKALFNAYSNDNIYNELWVTDGTLAGTSRVSTTPINIIYFKALDNKILFTGSTDETGEELWCYTYADSTDYVDGISLYGTAPASSSVQIQYSLDGTTNWTDITTVTANTDGQWTYTYSPSNMHTHYIRAYETTYNNASSSVMVTYTEPEPEPQPEPGPIVSNICFAKNTPIETDQGIFPIQKLVPNKHTINGNPIRHITKTTHSKKYLIKICKHALGHNIPNQDTILSDYHKVLYNDSMVQAQQLLGIEGVEKIDYNGEILYNVLLDTYEMIRVNNMTAETLHPKNTTAKLYRKMMGEDVTVEARQKYIMQLTTININIDYKDIIIHYGTNHAIDMEFCNSAIVMDDDDYYNTNYNLTHQNRYKGIRISITTHVKPFIEEDVPLVIGKTQINQSIRAKVSLQIKHRPVRRRIKK